jgi:pyridoxine/pyridoxamine 5'-phosphate oxidase
MVARHHPVARTRAAKEPRNWGLLLVVVLCLEFWLVMTSYLAQNL